MGMPERQVLLNPKESDKKFFHCQIKSVDDKKRKIKGFASTRFKDRANDIVKPDAFKNAMEVFMQNPIILLQHNPENPIGKVKDFQIVNDGLWVEVEIGEGTKAADEAWSLINQDILKAFSIGFFIKDWSFDQQLDAMIINELELVEISIVSIPANRESLFSVVKAMRDGSDTVETTKTKLAILGIRQHMTFLKNVYATLQTSEKIEVDAIANELQNLSSLDERRELLSEADELSKQILIASLGERLSDSGKTNSEKIRT